MEIGVHHGRLFIAMNALTEAWDRSVALDVFDDQHLNIDKSGAGNAAHFKANLERFDRHRGTNVFLFKADSTCITAADVLALSSKPFKIVSIDGGHTAEHTISDLTLAAALVQPMGLVIVDDILHAYWLGVIDGVVTFLDRRPTLVPLCIGHNKLILCKLSARPAYQALFEQSGRFDRPSALRGYPILPFRGTRT